MQEERQVVEMEGAELDLGHLRQLSGHGWIHPVPSLYIDRRLEVATLRISREAGAETVRMWGLRQ